MNKKNIICDFFKYYNSLSILNKFLIPSAIGFVFFLSFYFYILFNTSSMKVTIQQINTESIPIYETIFDNEFLLQKISYELQNAVVSNELDWVKDTNEFRKKILDNLDSFSYSDYKNELLIIRKSFNDYYISATNLANNLIQKPEDYDDIHDKTTLVINKYNEILELFQNLREKLKNNIKNDINISYSTTSRVLFTSSYSFIAWVILSTITLFYIYKDIKSRIYKIVEESENIASGEVNFHKRLSSVSADELGLVVNSINIFISKLEKSHLALENAKDDIKRFIADTVHQARTPLSSILINAEMIKELQKDDSLTTYIDSIDASISMLSNSYEDLSYIISYDTIEYNPSIISLTNLVNKRIDFFETICRENLKNIEFNIQDDILTYINIIENERIIDNNISNAIKYAFTEKPIYISLQKSDQENQVILEFKSYGDEIKDKEKIFNKNYREYESKRGLGLGLNIVKIICDKYDISYHVSYKNKQNVFTYTFTTYEESI